MSATDPCFDKQDGMPGVEQAIEQLLSRATAITATQRVDLPAGADRVLAEDLASPIDVPGFDNSDMDGYALHSRDSETARDAGLPVTQRITAGTVGEKLQPGKPLAFGRIGDTPFMGLPGNPVSVFLTFLLFARPCLQALQGRADTGPRCYPVRAGFDRQAKQRREYARVQAGETVSFLPFAEWAR